MSAFYLEFEALDIFVELYCNPNHRFQPHLLQSIFFCCYQGERDCRWNHGEHALPREGVPGNLGEDQVPREAVEAAGGQGLPHPIPRIQVRLIYASNPIPLKQLFDIDIEKLSAQMPSQLRPPFVLTSSFGARGAEAERFQFCGSAF